MGQEEALHDAVEGALNLIRSRRREDTLEEVVAGAEAVADNIGDGRMALNRKAFSTA